MPAATMNELLGLVKQNLILEHSSDDTLLQAYITAAVTYAEGFQHLPDGHYTTADMSAHTKQGVVMLASFFYESRDGGTGGFFSSSTAAASEIWTAVNCLFRLDREWKV